MLSVFAICHPELVEGSTDSWMLRYAQHDYG
jgi:hypothetical protein